MSFSVIIVAILMLAALGSLVFGVITMARGGDSSGARQNKLMAYRIWFQAGAIVLLMAVFYMAK